MAARLCFTPLTSLPLCHPRARSTVNTSVLLASDRVWVLGSVHHDRSSRQAHVKLSPRCGQMALFSPGLKLLLEENRKCCHRSGADLLTLGSQQPLPTHKQQWAKWGWALGWGSSLCVCVHLRVLVGVFEQDNEGSEWDIWALFINKQTTGIVYLQLITNASSFFLYLNASQFRVDSLTISKCVVWMSYECIHCYIHYWPCYPPVFTKKHVYV